MGHLRHLPHVRHLPHLFGGSAGGSKSYAQLAAALNPVARYLLAEPSGTTMVAAVGTNGTYTNGPTFGQAGAVRGAGTSTRFASASTQHGDVTVSSAALPTGAMTVLAWVRIAATGAVLTVIENGDASFSWGLQVLASGMVQLFWSDGVGGFNQSQSSSAALTPGLWYLVSASITAGSTPTVAYTVNGVAGGGGTGSGQLASGNNLQIGQAVGDQYMNGWMNDVMIVASVVSPARMLALYNAGAKTLVSVASVAHSGATAIWTFDTSMNPVTSNPSASDMAALEINAGGSGYIAPATNGPGGGNAAVQPSYAVNPVATNAWRILTDPVIPFGADHYLRVPSSGTVA